MTFWPESVEEAFQEKAGFRLSDHLEYACYVGSTSHNTYVPKADPNSFDDIDIFAVVVPPIERTVCLTLPNSISPWKKSEHLMVGEWDLTIHSMDKYLGLLLNGNPTVLSTLWVREQDRVFCSYDFLHKVIFKRDRFSTKESFHSFAGYAGEQLRKMTSSENAYQGYMGEKRKLLVDKFGYDTKNAAHLIRLLKMCVEFLSTGELKVFRDKDAEELRSVKRGEWSLSKVQEVSEELFEKAREAYQKSELPERPDFQYANQALLDFYRSGWRIGDR